MDRNSISASPRHPVAVGLACLLTASLAGCSEFRGNRANDAPKIGSLSSAGVDPYLSLNNTPSKAQASTAAAKADVPDLKTEPLAPTRPGPGEIMTAAPVSLGAPLAMPLAVLEPPAGSVGTAKILAPPSDPARLVEGREVVAKSRAKVVAMSNYQVQINRQERVGDLLQPAEDVVLSIRREPRAVRLEWPSGTHKGREVIYSSSDPSGLLHVNTSVAGVPVPPLHVAPDSPMVMRSSRHPITEAGFDTILTNLEKSLDHPVDGSKVAYEGVKTPSELGRPCHRLVRNTPTGEVWVVFIDEKTLLPAMVEAKSQGGDLLERYWFRDIRPDLPELAAAEAFDPAKRWGTASGLLGRIARTAVGDAR